MTLDPVRLTPIKSCFSVPGLVFARLNSFSSFSLRGWTGKMFCVYAKQPLRDKSLLAYFFSYRQTDCEILSNLPFSLWRAFLDISVTLFFEYWFSSRPVINLFGLLWSIKVHSFSIEFLTTIRCRFGSELKNEVSSGCT